MMSKIGNFLGLNQSILVLLMAIVLASTGERLWLGFVPKYLEILGASVFFIGLFDALQTFLGAIYAYPGAWITDKMGQRASLFLFGLLALLGYAMVYFWKSPYAILLGSFLFLAWSALSLPATFSLIASSLKKEKHTMGIGVQSLIRRIPMAIGPLLGGSLVLHWGWNEGIEKALLICMLLAFLTMILQLFMREKKESQTLSPESQKMSFFLILKSFSPQLKQLLLSDIFIRFCERIPYAFVILWAMNQGQLNSFEFSILVSIEMAVAAICYIPVSHLADKHGQRPFVLATFVFFTLFPLSLIFAHNFFLFAIAFAIRGLKEFGEPARKALIISYADPKHKSRAYGVYYLVRDVVVTSGSFLGAFLWSISPYANFLGAAFLGAMGFFIFNRKLRLMN